MSEKDEELQKKYMNFQVLQQQIKDTFNQLEDISRRISEVDSIIFAVKDFSEFEKGSEILVPLSTGIFVKAEIKDTNNFLVNIGANVVNIKNKEDLIKMLEKQKVELYNFQTELSKEYESQEEKILKLQQEIKVFSDNIKNKK
jgi:prefoldin alpha subunit